MEKIKIYGAYDTDEAGEPTTVRAWFKNYNDAVKCQLDIGICKFENEYTKYYIKTLDEVVYESYDEWMRAVKRADEIKRKIEELQTELKSLKGVYYGKPQEEKTS